MKKQLLIVGTMLAALSGCVTETTYVGKEVVQNSVDNKTAAKTRLSLAVGYMRKGDMAQAKLNIEKALSFDPDNPNVYLTQAYYYQTVGDLTSAESSYRQLLARDGTNADAMNNYGAFLCANKRYKEADEQFNLALKQPKYVRMDDTYENAALCSLKSGDKKKAAQYFDQAIGYNPGRGKLLLSASELALMDNNPAKAETYLKRYSVGGKESAQSLWLRLQLAQAQGEIAMLHKYGRQLVQQYPKSDQARRYLNNDY
ncbi:type IV pilus biogenesis/stability protein PilW [Pseudaeromonas sharmana]|uniref:Type IV pilus biogenesis/stability protein PilW n=1 Tax=Pseudaeromonas sharmana TaxID=328412 RepID=A0ABV8CSG4_9GAMM